MRRICYSIAMSLDGYVAGPQGEYDWIVMDPEIDFASVMDRFDAIVMGRKSFEASQQMGGGPGMPGVKVYVVSNTLKQDQHPEVHILAHDLKEEMTRMRNEPGKDLWLFGGGHLFRSLLEFGLVDTVEVAVIPVLLGGGIPLLPNSNIRCKLKLKECKTYKKTGTVSLEYTVA
jgi:dihydrofolate reductase